MIVNSSIKNGFLSMKKEGMFFGIVSCSGIIKVTLLLNGGHVLESKMWVGMSLPQAMPYDTIRIESELDQPVEFWAGKMPMTQSGSMIVRGANAIRCSKIAVMGEALITGTDLTRSAVRVRTDKEVMLGGAGFGGVGWRLPAGNYEEIPLAGSLYAYRLMPVLKVTESVYIESITGKFPDSTDVEFMNISDDETVMLTWKFNATPKIWTAGTGWIPHANFASHVGGGLTDSFGFYKDIVTKKLYAIVFNGSNGAHSLQYGSFYIYESADNGLNFDLIKLINFTDKTSAPANNSSTKMHVIKSGNVLSMSLGGVGVGFNVETREWNAVAAGQLPVNHLNSGISRFWFTSNDMTQASWLSNQDYILRHSLDLVNWDKTFTKEFTDLYVISNQVMLGWNNYGVRRHYITNDGGVTWHDTGANLGNGEEDMPVHMFDGIWCHFYGDVIRTYQIADGALVVSQSLDVKSGSGQSYPYILPNGKVYRLNDTKTVAGFYDADVWQLNLVGDLTPALVEVMELLS
ncbi:hypothetical protein [Shewanella violacea]|uniref:BNR repeat protein n=1 Tax=Shewanella violacea (strain JCM 10179 / CIP 106290 / LMG 19151 / DSS12) TaxID=637905 RepID=D4ZKF5_SHEVD|nr:hypothetical protein [Shewanella violacea]BAJ02154.1 BNR repeat protein [Shewanella violacea DSS12]